MQNSSVEGTKNTANKGLTLGGKHYEFNRPLVMGILNITPDSFYEGSRISNEHTLIERVKEMLNDGADIIDVGGYSSRPGATDISIKEEISRVIPSIKLIMSHFPEAIVSIDTFRSEVAEAALNEGAMIINDISGYSIDPAIVDVAAKFNAPYILMHMRGTPQTMMDDLKYVDITKEVYSYFEEKIKFLNSKGVKNLILDPGFGFSKTLEQNYELLEYLNVFTKLDLPILFGVSRKSMIYKKLGITPEESLNGTIALNAIGLSKGANILRVHDVKEAKQLVELLFK